MKYLHLSSSARPCTWRLPQVSCFFLVTFTGKSAKCFYFQRAWSGSSGSVGSVWFNPRLVSFSSVSLISGWFLPKCRGMASIIKGIQCNVGIEKGKGLICKNSDGIANGLQCNVLLEKGVGIVDKKNAKIANGMQCNVVLEKGMGIANKSRDEIAIEMELNVGIEKETGIVDENCEEIVNGHVRVEKGKGKVHESNDEIENGVNKEQRIVDKSTDDEIHEVVALLRQCAKRKDLIRGSRLHLDIVEKGMLKMNPAIGNTLMDMYAKCNKLEKAQNVFDSLPIQSVASWTVLISAYVQHGHGQVALNRFQQMLSAGYSPNGVTYACILKACGIIGALEVGEEIHHRILKYGLLEKDVVLANSLVHMYTKCGALPKAQKVFDNLRVKPLESWTSLISGYTQHGNSEAALRCYREMQNYGTTPSVVTFVCILRACGNIGALNVGQEIEKQIEKEHLLQNNIVVGNALVDMYAKCGRLRKAEEVFQKLSMRNVISWTTLIAGYVQHGYGLEALSCFDQMQAHQVSPNAVSLVCALKACGIVRALHKGLEIHGQIRRDLVLEENSLIVGALVYMYTRCNMIELAKEAFNKPALRDVTLWTTLIAGHVQNGCYEEAIDLFEKMLHEGHTPNAATYSSILKACGVIGTAEKGHTMFTEIDQCDFLKTDIVLANSVLDMYAKTGSIEKAHNLFDKLPGRDLVSWNTLISGNAYLGKYELVVSLFNKLITGGLIPDPTTFTLLLVSCNNAGFLDEAQFCFENMLNGSYGITPTLEHHVCIVDLFGRAGQVDKAVVVVNEMPFSTHVTPWYAVMSDCHKWSNLGI